MSARTNLAATVTFLALAFSLAGCPELDADGGSGPCETTPPSARLVAVPALSGVGREGTVALITLRDLGNPCALEEDLFGDVDCECAEDEPEQRALFDVIRAECLSCNEISVGPNDPISKQVTLRVVPGSSSFTIDVDVRTSDGLEVATQLWLDADGE